MGGGSAYDLPVEYPEPNPAAIRDGAHGSEHSYIRQAYYELLICAGAVTPLDLPPDHGLMVGDRLETDIKMRIDVGMETTSS
jgi:hypothetical protein